MFDSSTRNGILRTDFRRRTSSDIWHLAKRRKWLIGLPALAVFVSVSWVVSGLPSLYESTTLLTIAPPKISEKVAPSLTDDDLSQRLQAIGQVVLSRTSLEPLIEKFDLFKKERANGAKIDSVVERLKANIKVDPEKAPDNRIVGFRISFRSTDPIVSQKVVTELAEKYVMAQTIESKQSAETTKEFIDNQMAQARSNLDELDKQRIDIMSRNVNTLPESGQGLIAQLQGLRQREQTISKDKETLITERGRLQESIRSVNSQISLVETFGEKETQDAVNQASRIEDTPAYGQLVQKRAELGAKLENLKKQYREKHPDIIQMQTEINKVNEELDRLARNTDQRVKSANQASSRKTELQKRNLEIEREKYENNVQQIGRQIQSKDDELRLNLGQITVIESKINTIPSVKVELEGINNQYSSAKATYEDLLKKYNNAQQQVDREANEQGESIKVVDPASLPQVPINASKKPLFMVVGLAGGLFLGLLLTSFFEVPRLLKLQNSEDVEHYMGISVFAAVPPLLSDGELARRRRAGWLRFAAGLAVMIVCIPVIIAVLQLSRIFERLS